MAKPKCPYCGKKSEDKDSFSHHITMHVVDGIRVQYPGLLEMIEKVEGDMPVKFLLKVDTAKVVDAQLIAKGVLEQCEAAGAESGQGRTDNES